MASDSKTIDDAQRCPSCGGANNCTIAQNASSGLSEQQCWCMIEPIPIGAPLPTSSDTSCYCQRCLQKLVTENAPQLHKPNIPR